MKAVSVLFVFLLLTLGCKEDIDQEMGPTPYPVPAIYCLTTSPVSGVLPVDETCTPDTTMPDHSIYCNVIEGDTLMLTDASKCWIPQYDFELGEVFEYRNEAGETLELTLADKGHLMAKRVLETIPCDSSEYDLGVCYTIESYYIMLQNEQEEINIYIEMSTDLMVSTNPEYDGLPDEQMRILNKKPNGYIGYTLRAAEFDDSPFLLTEFESEKVLLNKIFTNVYQPGGFYYTKEIGLVSFGGGAWVLQE